MPSWRLLKSETHNAFANMAIDEAIVRARIEGKVPNTLRFYRWSPSAVSIGRFQNIHNEVQLENCRAHDVDVVRRISGGGAVYHDSEDEITYSVVAKQEDLGTHDVAEAYNHVCNGLIEAAHILGVAANYNEGDVKQCPNIVVHGRKISGSAQAHKKGVILQHGTFLIDVDLEKMFTLLKVPLKDACVDFMSIAKRKITSVAGELGNRLPMNRVYQALVEGFERALDTSLLEGSLTNYELSLAQKLEKEKFAAREWNVEGKTAFMH